MISFLFLEIPQEYGMCDASGKFLGFFFPF